MSKKVFTKPVATTEPGALAALWRKIVEQLGIGHRLNAMLDEYVARNSSKDITKGRTQVMRAKSKSTMSNNIFSDELSIKTFLDILFNFLRVKKITLTVTLTHANNQETIHSYGINPARDVEDEQPSYDLPPFNPTGDKV